MSNPLKVTMFWLVILWLPVLGFTVITVIAGVVPVVGVVLPIILVTLFASATALSVCSSGMLQEDRDKGDAGIMSMVQRTSQVSVSGRRSLSSEQLDAGGLTSQSSSASIANEFAGTAAAANPSPDTYGQQSEDQGFIMSPALAPKPAAPSASADIGKWQVEMDHSNWVDFEDAQQKAFSAGLLQGKEKVEFQMMHQRYELVYADGVQRNTRTGKERRVRCVGPGTAAAAEPAAAASPPPAAAAAKAAAAPPAKPPVEWQVQMDSGSWIDMDGVSNAIINDAKDRGDAAAFFRSHNQDYELNFTACTQKNVKTGKERPIRQKRVPPAAGKAQAGGPPPLPAGDSSNPAGGEDSIGM